MFLLVVTAIWFYKDYKYQKAENIRQTENIASIRKQDSLRFALQTYSKTEFDEFLEFQRKDLKKFLDENKVRTKRIERIITQQLKYQDNQVRETNLQPILDAIKEKRNMSIPVKDSTDCLVVEGWVKFKNDSLKLELNKRKFKNVIDVVTYWERRQWKFLGIKTRLFGKKQATVIIKDNCGRSQTLVIDKRK